MIKYAYCFCFFQRFFSGFWSKMGPGLPLRSMVGRGDGPVGTQPPPKSNADLLDLGEALGGHLIWLDEITHLAFVTFCNISNLSCSVLWRF